MPQTANGKPLSHQKPRVLTSSTNAEVCDTNQEKSASKIEVQVPSPQATVLQLPCVRVRSACWSWPAPFPRNAKPQPPSHPPPKIQDLEKDMMSGRSSNLPLKPNNIHAFPKRWGYVCAVIEAHGSANLHHTFFRGGRKISERVGENVLVLLTVDTISNSHARLGEFHPIKITNYELLISHYLVSSLDCLILSTVTTDMRFSSEVCSRAKWGSELGITGYSVFGWDIRHYRSRDPILFPREGQENRRDGG